MAVGIHRSPAFPTEVLRWTRWRIKPCLLNIARFAVVQWDVHQGFVSMSLSDDAVRCDAVMRATEPAKRSCFPSAVPRMWLKVDPGLKIAGTAMAVVHRATTENLLNRALPLKQAAALLAREARCVHRKNDPYSTSSGHVLADNLSYVCSGSSSCRARAQKKGWRPPSLNTFNADIQGCSPG